MAATPLPGEKVLETVVSVTEGRTGCDVTIAEVADIADRRVQHQTVGRGATAVEFGRHGLRVTQTQTSLQVIIRVDRPRMQLCSGRWNGRNRAARRGRHGTVD